jgi:hypothetical protein
MNKFDVISIAVVCTMLNGAISQADVVVYKESCGHYAFEDWNLTCKIDKNTFNNKGTDDFWAEPFSDIQSITICASFNNRGRLNGAATIVYNYKDGKQSMPVGLFDTVKFQGSLITDKLTWVGTSPRLVWSPSWKMRGELRLDGRQDSFSYTETLLNGQRSLGEIRATCSYLEDK